MVSDEVEVFDLGGDERELIEVRFGEAGQEMGRPPRRGGCR